jgi:hypothetical protein
MNTAGLIEQTFLAFADGAACKPPLATCHSIFTESRAPCVHIKRPPRMTSMHPRHANLAVMPLQLDSRAFL